MGDLAQRDFTEVHHWLGVGMKPKESATRQPALLDVVALLADVPEHALARGQVGTVVEDLDNQTVLVEFSDDAGVLYAVAACPITQLLVLHYLPEAA